MKFASAFSCATDAAENVTQLVDAIRAELDPGSVDLLLLFCSAHFEDDVTSVAARLKQAFPTAVLLGCSAGATIGRDRELERSCSISLLAGHLPDVRIAPFYLIREDIPAVSSSDHWRDRLRISVDEPSLILALGDPFSFPIHDFLDQTNESLPGVPIMGGMASAAEEPGQNRLLCGPEIYTEGLVGLTLSGALEVLPVVSQGCRPIGAPSVITKAERNLIHELGGKPATARLVEIVRSLPPADLALAQQALFVGRVINEYQESFDRGDFLIQNIVGFDPQGGAIAVAAPTMVGATIQFHIRDAACADEDLRKLLATAKESFSDVPPAAALVFSCNGRGLRMWPDSPQGHDITVLRDVLGDVPAAGFFAAGEIGPVGGRNFIHGFTASIALIRKRTTG